MEVTKERLQKFILCFQKHSDFDLSEYSENSLIRRIEKVLQDNACDFETLLKKLESDLVFLHETLKKITVNTTELFRDVSMWNELRQLLLSDFMEKEEINIWHAGCSTGQEVYSMIILLNELNLLSKANIYASDINIDVINKAQEGKYSYRHFENYKESFQKVIHDNPFGKSHKHKPFEKYFDCYRKKDYICFDESLSKNTAFFVNDLVKLTNSTQKQFDIILCRNVLIYFNIQLQGKVYNFFHENLKDSSCLIIGKQESMSPLLNSMFNKKGALYIKK